MKQKAYVYELSVNKDKTELRVDLNESTVKHIILTSKYALWRLSQLQAELLSLKYKYKLDVQMNTKSVEELHLAISLAKDYADLEGSGPHEPVARREA